MRSLADAASWIVVVFLGVLAHELGHALAMRRIGASPSIELDAMGGRTEWDTQARPRPHQEMLVSLAGPAAGLLVGLLRDAGPLVATNRALVVISAALFYEAHFLESLAVCERGGPCTAQRHAFNAACCCARAGRIDEGLDLDLERAGYGLDRRRRARHRRGSGCPAKGTGVGCAAGPAPRGQRTSASVEPGCSPRATSCGSLCAR